MLEQEVNFIKENIGLSALCLILGNAVQDTVQNHQHTDGHELLAKLMDVIANESAPCIDIGRLCKGIQRTVREKLNGKSNVLRFGFALLQKHFAEILQCGSFPDTSL